MGHAKKLHREPLPDDVAAALLASPILDGIPAGDKLKSLRGQMAETVRAVRAALAANPVAEIVATATAKKIGRRGDAAIVIDDNGAVMLEIRYQGDGDKRGWHSNLPSLGELRDAALGLGIDADKLGRSKRKLTEAIKKASAG